MSSNKIGQSLFDMTRFQLILPVDSHNATKNRTDHRMHVEGPQICQVNRWNKSLQNMYGRNRQQLARICAKKHLVFVYFGGHKSELPDLRGTWTSND